MNKTIIILTAKTQYDVISSFVSGISSAFEELGYDTEIIERSESGFGDRIVSILRTRNVYFFFGFGYGGFDLTNDEISFYDKINIPLFSFLIDNPLYIKAHTGGKWDNGVVNHIMSCVDMENAKFLRKRVHTSLVPFIPHATSVLFEKYQLKPISERSIDILFPGTYVNPDKIREEWKSDIFKEIYDGIVEASISSNKPFLKVLETSLSEKGLLLEHFYGSTKFWYLVSKVDQYIRYYIRGNVLTSLVEYGLPVRIYGYGWEEFSDKAVINNGVNFEQIQTLMLNSKLVLTSNPSYTSGLHERILHGMASGAVSVADTNGYLEECFTPNNHLLTYSNLNFEELAPKLNSILQNPEQMQWIADSGYEATRQKHTWKQRASEILKYVDMHKGIQSYL